MEVGGNIYIGKRVVVRFSYHVETEVVTTWPPATVIFLDEVREKGSQAGHFLTQAHFFHP